MKKNLPVTDHEIKLTKNNRIISTTDKKGRILYVNDDFVEISGYNKEQLERSSHNIVRHPDMPCLAFQNLWDTLKLGKPWMGIVKNRCKNGDFYWVDAYVTPIYENDKVTGYQSVRIKPEAEYVRNAEKIYKNADTKKPNLIGNIIGLFSGLRQKVILAGMLIAAISGYITYSLSHDVIGSLTLFSVVFLLNMIVGFIIVRPVIRLAQETKSIVDNPVLQLVYTNRSDEFGQIRFAIKFQEAKMRTMNGRIEEAAEQLGAVADKSNSISSATSEGALLQKAEIEQVATAVNEMSATVQEVAKNAASTADATAEADKVSANGQGIVDATVRAIGAVADELRQTSDVITKLQIDSENIGSVIDVISEIAEQTNLLALNAAIEAARAGEQGRGFAVVADEVRTLANRTQKSTNEIQKIIESLQQAANQSVDAMAHSQKEAEKCVENAGKAGKSLTVITTAIENIAGMSTQIATASEEQSTVAEEINRNINNISAVADQTAMSANETKSTNAEVIRLVKRLHSMVKQFSID